MRGRRGDAREAPWLTAERLAAFTDGILAIIITILVLGIEIPKGHDFTREGFVSFVLKIEHDVLVYLMSFVLVLTYWLQHYVLFHYVARTDRKLVFWNGAFLFLLSLSPFTTGLAGVYRGVPVVDAVFGLTYFLSGMAFFGMWRYCAANEQLLNQPIDRETRRSMDRHILVAPLLSLLGIVVAQFNFHVAAVVYVSIPFFYTRHVLVDTRWRARVGGTD